MNTLIKKILYYFLNAIEKKDKVQISLKVLLNEEFTFKILGMGAFCVVDKPASLRKIIRGAIQNMATNYK